MKPWLLSISLAYLLGSIPFGYLLVRIFRKQDIRATGSGNIGATNVARSGAKGLGIATLLLDLGKGSFAVLAAFQIARHTSLTHQAAFNLAAAAAMAAVVGHIFPVWLAFRGGKGVATALGVFAALSPATALGILVVFAIIFALTRYVSLASIVASATVPIFLFLFARNASAIVWFAFIFIPVLVIAKHHENIRRLLAGTEARFGKKASA